MECQSLFAASDGQQFCKLHGIERRPALLDALTRLVGATPPTLKLDDKSLPRSSLLSLSSAIPGSGVPEVCSTGAPSGGRPGRRDSHLTTPLFLQRVRKNPRSNL